MNELSRTNNSNRRRTPDVGRMVHWAELFFSPGPTRQDRLHGCRWYSQSRHCQEVASFAANSSIMASAVFIFTPDWSRKRCSSSRTQTENSSTQNRCFGRGHITQQASKCDPLEHAEHGRSSRTQPVCGDSHLAQTQLKTTPCRNIQAQSGQTIQRKTPRRGRSLSQSTGQGARALCRREESNSSTRTNSSDNAGTSGNSRTSNSRLHSSRNNNLIRSFKHARWQSHWRLHATTSASGIYPVPAIDQCQNAGRFGTASYCRQLRDAQTCSCEVMAETPSSIPFAFYSHIQLMAQHGRTLVPGNHRQTHSARLIQKRPGINRRDHNISRESQPKSARFYLERIG